MLKLDILIFILFCKSLTLLWLLFFVRFGCDVKLYCMLFIIYVLSLNFKLKLIIHFMYFNYSVIITNYFINLNYF
jgi:hypothetical protein